MGLVSRFFGKKAEAAVPPAAVTSGAGPGEGEVRFQIPTVKARPELFDAYAKVFREEMASVALLSRTEIEVALALISEGEGGFLNQGRYFKTVFDTFFRDTTWCWPWYDQWDARFASIGRHPSGWIKCGPSRRKMLPADVVPRLTVSNLKELMSSAGISYPDKAKGAVLREIALSSAGNSDALANAPQWIAKSETVFHPAGYANYSLLMRTIASRARSLETSRRAARFGMKTELRLVVLHDREFADIAVAERPDALPPLFPGDVSYLRVRVPGFD